MADSARDPEALTREIERTRADLAATIDAIADRVSPKNVAKRGIERVKGEVDQVVGVVTGAFTRPKLVHEGEDEDTYSVRPAANREALLLAGAAIAVTAVAVLAIRRRRRKRRR